MKDKEPSEPETWRGGLIALLTQFGVPGGLISKILGRTKTAGRLKKTIDLKNIKKNDSSKSSLVKIIALFSEFHSGKEFNSVKYLET